MSYELFRGPDPRHYGRLRTWDAILREAYADNWFFDHYTLEAPKFVGRMPVRQDLQVLAADVPLGRSIFLGWENTGMTMVWVRPTRWGNLKWRIKKFLGLIPKRPDDGKMVDIFERRT